MTSFFSELRRRSVFKIAAAYLIASWLLIQVGELLFPVFGAPDWVLKTFIGLVLLGFPLAVILAWALEITPDGIVRQAELDTRNDNEAVSTTPSDNASIAVLPFNNMSNNSEFDHLADGMSEDIITYLSRVPGFLVVARNSSFA